MGLFGNLTTEGLEESQDRLGGGYSAFDANVYTGKIKQFYAIKSSGGADGITVILSNGDFGDREYRETVYITSKEGKNFYMAKDKSGAETGKKNPLPGFSIINDMCQAVLDKELEHVDFEDKIVNIYDPEVQKEVPKSVKVAVEMLDKEVSVAIRNTLESQTEKDGQGNYVPKTDGSTRNVNNIEKVFNTPTRMTIAEARGGATEAAFWDAWVERNAGKVIDKTTKNAGTAGRPTGGAPQPGAAAGGAAPRTSLFSK